jgi:LmbE family N-acetylglucosaminyl deacetylase
LLPADKRLVVVAPHPDDEVLACGALLARHAAVGGDILIVAASDGEASHRGVPGSNPERLAAMRRDESAEGLHRLGARDVKVHRLGLPDGGLSAHVDDLAHCLTGLLRPFDVVISTWRLDGHPDHEASGRAAARACDASRCRLLEAPVWMWHWATPGDSRVPWHRLVGLAVPARTVALKQDALAAHATQLRPRGAVQGPVLCATMLARASWSTEYFMV